MKTAKTITKTANVETKKKNSTKSTQNKAINKALNADKPKKKRDVYATDYGKEVLTVNKRLKEYSKTFKGALTMLHLLKSDAELKLTAKQTKIIMNAKKGKNKDKIYKFLQDNTRTSSKGNCCAFYVLQAIRKNQKELLELVK